MEKDPSFHPHLLVHHPLPSFLHDIHLLEPDFYLSFLPLLDRHSHPRKTEASLPIFFLALAPL